MSRWAAAVFLASVCFNFFYNATLPLHFDEAYYWIWSNHLQLSYFDHPPMIGWLIRLATFWGDAEWQIRLVPLLCMTMTGLLLWNLANDMFGDRVATKALLIFLLSPLVQIGFSLATPDAPLILGWTAAVFFTYKAIFHDKRPYYYAAGLAAGFAVLSKYTAVLLLPGLLLFLFFSSHRSELRKKELYLGIGLTLLAFLPVVFWNAGHDWSSFRFQLGHGLAGGNQLNPATFAEYIGAQAVVLSPVFFFFLLYLVLRRFHSLLAEERQAFLLWPCLTVIAFFGYTALFKRAEGNWAAPAYVTGIILLAKWLDSPAYTRLYKSGIVLGVILTMLLKVPEFFPFLPRSMVMKRLVVGYDVMFRSGGGYLHESTMVLAADYKLASLAWYYLPGRPTVHVLNPSRASQFDEWRKNLQIPAKEEAVFFGGKDDAAALSVLFHEVTPSSPLKYNDRYISREIQVFQCRGLKQSVNLAPVH